MEFVEGERFEVIEEDEEGGMDNITRILNETSASFVSPHSPPHNPPSIFTECFHVITLIIRIPPQHSLQIVQSQPKSLPFSNPPQSLPFPPHSSRLLLDVSISIKCHLLSFFQEPGLLIDDLLLEFLRGVDVEAYSGLIDLFQGYSFLLEERSLRVLIAFLLLQLEVARALVQIIEICLDPGLEKRIGVDGLLVERIDLHINWLHVGKGRCFFDIHLTLDSLLSPLYVLGGNAA